MKSEEQIREMIEDCKQMRNESENVYEMKKYSFGKEILKWVLDDE